MENQDREECQVWQGMSRREEMCCAGVSRDVLNKMVIWCDKVDRAYRDIPESLKSLLAANLGTGVTLLRHFSECNFATCTGRHGVA